MIMTLGGIVAGFLRFGIGIKPDFLEIKVFAIYSIYFKTKYFSIIGNNISEEIAGILLLTGLFFISFAREKNETSNLWPLRIKALLIAIYINTTLLFLSFIFVFGLGFFFLLSVNLFSLFIIYNLFFRYFIYRYHKSS
jgi:hypothetical protein